MLRPQFGLEQAYLRSSFSKMRTFKVAAEVAGFQSKRAYGISDL